MSQHIVNAFLHFIVSSFENKDHSELVVFKPV